MQIRYAAWKKIIVSYVRNRMPEFDLLSDIGYQNLSNFIKLTSILRVLSCANSYSHDSYENYIYATRAAEAQSTAASHIKRLGRYYIMIQVEINDMSLLNGGYFCERHDENETRILFPSHLPRIMYAIRDIRYFSCLRKIEPA
jgi:hypothetical protein